MIVEVHSSNEAVSLLCACYTPVLAFNQLNILLRHSDNLGKQIEGGRGKYTCVKERKCVSTFEPLKWPPAFKVLKISVFGL